MEDGLIQVVEKSLGSSLVSDSGPVHKLREFIRWETNV